MLIGLKKKLKTKVKHAGVATAAITCGDCGHVREPTASNPQWQCPCCGKAYAKVNETDEEYSRRMREENRAQEQQKRAAKKIENQTLGGISAGFITFIAGMGSACSGAAANPLVQAAGILIAIGAAAYGLNYYLS